MNRDEYRRMAEEYREQAAVLAARRDKLIREAKTSPGVLVNDDYIKRCLILDQEIKEMAEAAAAVLKYAEA